MSSAAQYAGRPVVIYGPQGCGKTRLLPRLAALCGKTRIVEEWWDGEGALTLDADSIAETGAPPPYASAPDAVALSYEDAADLVASGCGAAGRMMISPLYYTKNADGEFTVAIPQPVPNRAEQDTQEAATESAPVVVSAGDDSGAAKCAHRQ